MSKLIENSPRKSLGQHWLNDEISLLAMVEAGEVNASDTVLEIGPGLGTLTKILCERAKKVIAIELDDILAASLAEKVATKNLEVVHESILDYDLSTLPKNYKVVANIPYYLTAKLIRKLLETSNPPKLMVLLVQKEVAQRIVARPGQMSILAVSVQFYAEAKVGDVVPARLFTPPPKVDSQIIQIKFRSQPLFEGVDSDEFFRLVKAGFSEKRKKLRSSLNGGLHLPKDQVDAWLKEAGIKADARAQELSLQQWRELLKTK